jgi:hypothetical protein
MKQNRIIGGSSSERQNVHRCRIFDGSVQPDLYTNLTAQTLSGGDTTTNPPTPASDYFVLVKYASIRRRDYGDGAISHIDSVL